MPAGYDTKRVALRSRVFRLIHAFHSDTCTVAPLLGRWAGVPVITSRRDQGYWQSRRVVSVLRRANRAAARIISNSHAVAQRTIEVEHALPSQLVVVGNGPRSPSIRLRHAIVTCGIDSTFRTTRL